MKKIFLVLAAALTTATLAFAQDYNEVVEAYNKGAEAIENKDIETALACFQEAYAKGAEMEEAAEIVATCKEQIPVLSYNLAVRDYNDKLYQACIAKCETAIALAEQFGNADKAKEGQDLLADARYFLAKELEDTDIEAAKEALKALAENGEPRAAGRMAFLLSKDATDLQKEAQAIQDAAAKKEAFQKVYEIAKESIAFEESAAAYKTLATAARNIDNWEEAVLGYEKYLELKPEAKDAISITNNLAMCYEKVGDKVKALECYKKVAESDNEKLKAKAAKKVEALSK